MCPLTRRTDVAEPAAVRTSLASFRGIHQGLDVLVCGCGESLNLLEHPERFISIGVNDVGRRFHPNYLVVVNPRNQFKADRFQYVASSKAQYIFTQLPNLGIPHVGIVHFRLGKYGGTDFTDPGMLHYTQNSPYVALCLAAHMGARRIGLIGVDFTDHHFFAKTGAHPLSRNLQAINTQYRRLAQALHTRGIKVFNLSPKSRLAAFPKMNIDEFEFGVKAVPAPPRQSDESGNRALIDGGRPMRVAITGGREGLIGELLNALAETAARLGYSVARGLASVKHDKTTLAIVWNGRCHSARCPTLYCEHGWLPRWAYQISARGINADSHIAPFVWDGKPLDQPQDEELERYLATIRQRIAEEHPLGKNGAGPVDNLPPAFLLVPLQMEWDTNIVRHVPARYRRMQALIDAIAAANPPLPVLFKQHPADTRRGNQHLRLRPKRQQDRIQPHAAADIHQLLNSGRCRGIITLNSNVAHDGLIWNVPAVVLGNNVWPREGIGPFLTTLPERWDSFFEMLQDPQIRACRRAYARYLMESQWTVEDARDPKRVQKLLHSALGQKRQAERAVRSARGTLPVINVVAANRGWLFEDYKRFFAATTDTGVSVVTSERPLHHATAWLYLRTREAVTSPDPARTVVQIHDVFDDGLYRPGGERRFVERCRGLVLTQPSQRDILERHGIELGDKRILDRPIGALAAFRGRQPRPTDSFTIGWIGRPVRHAGEDISRLGWVVEIAQRLPVKPRIVLLGEGLDATVRALRAAHVQCEYQDRLRNPIESYPRHYERFDCLLVTSRMDVGSHCLFEALASGVPVVSTYSGWAPTYIRNGENGFLATDLGAMVDALTRIQGDRKEWLLRRERIAASSPDYTLETWIKDSIRLAMEVAGAANDTSLTDILQQEQNAERAFA